MSDDVVIRAEGLGKKYMIGHQSGERYTSLRDVMAQTAKNFARTAGDMFRGKAIIAGDEVEEFWALKDVSFEIKRGDVVGIIGRNGAGKSTLLKVLSRITEPSEGRVEIRGRVASLLEVGTGFHPELTGRENIYLNGAILGMSREEIKRKFDEIVEFSGVEKFLDTPVKRYSSGMYVRLAFAVAAHLEPEILIVDEVLAVGDAEFQKKCLGKMQDVAGEGRTVLFVSHNIAAIQVLCSSSLLLKDGSITSRGSTKEVVQTYANQSKKVDVDDLPPANQRKGNGPVRFKTISFSKAVQTGAAIDITLDLDSKIPAGSARASLLFSGENEQPVVLFSSELPANSIRLDDAISLSISINKFPLTHGSYTLTVFLEVNGEVSDWIENYCIVEVESGDFFGSGNNLPSGWNSKICLVDHDWRVFK